MHLAQSGEWSVEVVQKELFWMYRGFGVLNPAVTLKKLSRPSSFSSIKSTLSAENLCSRLDTRKCWYIELSRISIVLSSQLCSRHLAEDQKSELKWNILYEVNKYINNLICLLLGETLTLFLYKVLDKRTKTRRHESELESRSVWPTGSRVKQLSETHERQAELLSQNACSQYLPSP
jgi:hypothetical protein